MPLIDFDWQADDEKEWDDPPPVEEKRPQPVKKRRPWLIGLLLAAGLLALGAYLLLDRRADQRVQKIEEEVLAAHYLLLEAVETGDSELFSSIVSDEDWSWFDIQAQTLSLDLFWGRTVLGLEPLEGDQEGEQDLAVAFTPDLQMATVTQTRSFQVINDRGGNEVVRLERAFVYERGDQGWRLGRTPGSQFWGVWESQSGPILTLTYPQRDASTGRPLFDYLNQLTNDFCSDPALECPPELTLELKLDRREESLLRINEGYSAVRILLRDGQGSLTLPAPSLVGRPLDDAGYQALARGYASWLGAVLINNFAPNNEGADPSVVGQLLAERDLSTPPWPKAPMPWPLTAASPTNTVRPPHDILLLCSGGSQQRLLRFQTEQGQWKSEWPFKANLASDIESPFPQSQLVRLPDYSGALVSFSRRESEGEEIYLTYLWDEGQPQLWLEHDRPPHLLNERFTKTSRRTLPGYYLTFENNQSLVDPWYIDLAACRSGQCEKKMTSGIPQWSPDGQHTILKVLNANNDLELHEGDSEGQSVSNLGSGLPLHWLNNEQFAYLRRQIFGVLDPAQNGVWRELVLKNWRSNDEQVVISTQRLKSGVAAERASFQLGIVTAEAFQDGWLIATREWGSPLQAGSYLFFYQPDSDTLTLVTENEMEIFLPPLLVNFGGPYLALSSLRRTDFLLRFLDPEDGQEVLRSNRFPDDWSADRQWLLYVEGPQLRISSPVNDFEWMIPHNLQGCYSAVWIDRV